MMFAQHAKCSLQSLDSVAINPINALVTSIDRFALNRTGDSECLPLFIVSSWVALKLPCDFSLISEYSVGNRKSWKLVDLLAKHN